MVSREQVGNGGVISFYGEAIGVEIFCVQFELYIHLPKILPIIKEIYFFD